MRRKLLLINNNGTNAYRFSLPAAIVKQWELTPDDRDIEIEMLGDALIVKRVRKDAPGSEK